MRNTVQKSWILWGSVLAVALMATPSSFAESSSQAEEAPTVIAQHPAMPDFPFTASSVPISDSPAIGSSTRAAMLVPREFVLGAGDVIKVTVWGYPELSEQVVVLPDGTCSYPLVGTLHVSDRTADDVAQTIGQALERHVESPKVSVVVTEMRSRRFSVLGAVSKAGTYPLWDDRVTVLEALSQAGGISDTALPSQVKIFRFREEGQNQGEIVHLNVSSVLDGELEASSLILKPGDVVYVPSQSGRRRVCVLGEVNVPGLYTLTPNMTVVEALTAAGWVRKTGVLKSVMVARRRQSTEHEFYQVDAYRVIREQDWVHDLALEPGDIVYVPQTFISKIGDFVNIFSSTVEPAAMTYLRVYDATDPASVLIDR